MAAIPGRILPSIASRSAPPPVDTYDTLSAKPNLFTQATESPPPTSENAPFSVASTIASAIAREPAVKLSVSYTHLTLPTISKTKQIHKLCPQTLSPMVGKAWMQVPKLAKHLPTLSKTQRQSFGMVLPAYSNSTTSLPVRALLLTQSLKQPKKAHSRSLAVATLLLA